MDSCTIAKDDMLYAHFGATALAAQVFEQNVSLALLMHSTRENVIEVLSVTDGTRLTILRESLDKQTLGKLVRCFQKHFAIDEETATELSRALSLRNALMHGYFPRNAQRMQSRAGREAMIAELEAHTETLWRATTIVAPFVSDEAEEVIILLKQQASIGGQST